MKFFALCLDFFDVSLVRVINVVIYIKEVWRKQVVAEGYLVELLLLKIHASWPVILRDYESFDC